MVLGKLPVPVRPTNLDNSRARAYCACSRCGFGLFGYTFTVSSPLRFLFSLNFTRRLASLHFVDRQCSDHRSG